MIVSRLATRKEPLKTVRINKNSNSSSGLFPNRVAPLKSNLKFGAVKILRPNDIPRLKPCEKLVLLAHPDDEACFFSFISNFLKDKKDSVQLVYATSGQKGRDVRGIIPRYDSKMGLQRENELVNALDEYKLERHPLILDLMDGESHYPENKDKMHKMLEKVVDNIKPKEVYTFDPFGVTTHSDHIAISEVTSDVLKRSQKDSYKDIKLWQVAFTEKSKNEFIDKTKDHTHMFLSTRASIVKPDIQFNISQNIPEIIDSFNHYKSQFPENAITAMKNYFTENPWIDLILKR